MPPLRIAVLALLLSASVLPAQRVELASIVTSPELAAGALLRVKNGPRQLSGRLVGVAGDTLLLRASPLPIRQRVPIALTSAVYLSAGPASRVRGALLGAGVGVLAGLFVGIVIADAFNGSASDAVELSPYFFPYFVPVGAVAGAVFPGHRWVRVTLIQR